MTRTPYDDDRRRYSRAALARLVLADHADGLAGAAHRLVITRYDEFCDAGGRVSEAAALAEGVGRLVADAVVYERERGSSWDDIGRYLGTSDAEAERRFTPVLDEWRTAFEVPYRLDDTGRKRIPRLPTAAYDPVRVGRNLDLSAHLNTPLYDDQHPVTGGLDGAAPEPAAGEIDGRVKQEHLETFVDLLASYLNCDATDIVRSSDSETAQSYTLAGVVGSLELRLTREPGSDWLSVVAINAHAAALRLRISTLLDAFARL